VVAVLEAENLTGDTGLDWVSTALSEAFASSLEPTRGLRVVAPRVVAERQFSLGVATAPQLGKLDGPRRIADSVGASYLVELTFRRDKPGPLLFRALVRSGSAARGLSRGPMSATAAQVEEVGSPEEIEAVAARLVETLRSRMRWERADPELRSPLIPTRPLPRDPEAKRLYAQGLRQLSRYDPLEALYLVRRALVREPDFVAAMTLMRYDLISYYPPTSLDFFDSDLFEQGLAHIAELPRSRRNGSGSRRCRRR
jgi:hypothetical protein